MLHTFNTEAFFPSSATWTPVSSTLVYSTWLTTSVTYTITISSSLIPQTATEMLLYTPIFCGTGLSNHDTYLQFYTTRNGVTYYKYLYLYSSSGDYTMNSENMWLPVPDNGNLYLAVTQSAGSCTINVHVIGYR